MLNGEDFEACLNHSTAMFMSTVSWKIHIDMVEYDIKIISWDSSFFQKTIVDRIELSCET